MDKKQIQDELKQHQQRLHCNSLQNIIHARDTHAAPLTFHLDDLYVDLSYNYLDNTALKSLLSLAEAADLKNKIHALFSGALVNFTEKRAALHTAFRDPNTPVLVEGVDVSPDIREQYQRMHAFVNACRDGHFLGFNQQPIDTIVNIGVGGSSLGPELIYDALGVRISPFRQHFISSMDGEEISAILPELNPATTLFIVASKTFSTLDTLSNAKTAKQWFIQKTADNNAWQKHFIALSTNDAAMDEFGILKNNRFYFWDFVGGRYSLWSALGMSIALSIGMKEFEALLAGAAIIDKHFKTADFSQNIPVLLGLIDIWYRNYFHCETRAILPYTSLLRKLPNYLQQLMMESLGKRVSQNGELLDCDTGTVIFGDVGFIGQHAFFQLLHQGTSMIPCDFIALVNTSHTLREHKNLALANCLAQREALMCGRAFNPKNETRHADYPGNKPSNLLLFPEINAKTLGTLIALYEHRTYVASVIWDINAFDQLGVELGKRLASDMKTRLDAKKMLSGDTANQKALFDYVYTHLK